MIKETVQKLAVLAGTHAQEHISNAIASYKEGDYRNIVTDIDLSVSTMLQSEIKKTFPEHHFYSEEGPREVNTQGYTWIIDPIDGTSNFVRQIPLYSTCVTLLKDGEVHAASVYAPALREHFILTDDGVSINEMPLRTSAITSVKDAYVNFHPGRKKENHNWAEGTGLQLSEKAKKIVNFASSALDLCYVAAGRMDIVVYGTLTTVDVSGAIEMVRRAGGEVYNFDTRQPVTFSVDSQKVIAVANTKLLKDYFTQITPM